MNSRLDELQAAILSVKLTYLEKDNARRREIAGIYREIIGKSKDVEIIFEKNGEISNYHQYPILVNNREDFQQFLKSKGVPSLIHYPIALPDQPLFGGKYLNIKLPVVRNFVNKELSLPIHPFLTDDEVRYIGKTVLEYFT